MSSPEEELSSRPPKVAPGQAFDDRVRAARNRRNEQYETEKQAWIASEQRRAALTERAKDRLPELLAALAAVDRLPVRAGDYKVGYKEQLAEWHIGFDHVIVYEKRRWRTVGRRVDGWLFRHEPYRSADLSYSTVTKKFSSKELSKSWTLEELVQLGLIPYDARYYYGDEMRQAGSISVPDFLDGLIRAAAEVVARNGY